MKKKIFVLSDHPYSTSGVATQSRWLLQGLINTGKYTFRCFGAAVKHCDYTTISPHPDLIIKPTDGFGTPEMIRHVLVTEKPDAMLLFTDPRFFEHIFMMEDEIHQICPILYNHLWDNLPKPTFNKHIYESVDCVNCINDLTYGFVREWFPKKSHYVPHTIPRELYTKISNQERLSWRERLLGKDKVDHFIALFVGRNARRKMIPDLLSAWKMFVDDIKLCYDTNKLTLVLHTDPLDQEGANLYSVCDLLGLQNNIVFSKERTEFDIMNVLYNIADVQLNNSSAEGFGLPILEGKSVGLPAIALKTGGLTRQVKDHIDGYEYGVAIDPDVLSLVGNQQYCPFIYESLCSTRTYADAIRKFYEFSNDKKREISDRCIAHVKRDYDYDSMISKWDETLTETIHNWKSTYNRIEKVTL